MKPIFDPPPEYYEHFKTRPVAIKPFDERSVAVASNYIEGLARILRDFDVEIMHRGSTALGIAGKGDIEIGVYPADKDWPVVVTALQSIYGPPGSLEANFARFNHEADGFEIEIILLRGYEALVDRKLHAYLREYPELCREYEQVKRRYCYSRREYQRQKDIFLRRVIEMMPED
jgi:GrpB-like predicted nucleotidyltransferase (UPF0157 family)